MAPSDDVSISSEEGWTTGGGAKASTHGNANGVVTTSRSKGVTSERAWVKRTFCMVNEGSQTQPNVISWSADGEVFEIRDVEALKRDLFTRYHGSTKFESFTRRLRRYGFHRERSEPIAKITAGVSSAVVLAFRHENFHRDRPERLTHLAIIPQLSEAPKPSEEQQTLASALARLEKSQVEIKNTVRQFEEQKLDQKSRIDHLRQQAVSKDETIRSLEFRLERLENSLLMGLGPAPSQHRSLSTAWAPNAQANQVRTHSTMTFAQPLCMPSQQLKGLERELSNVSAVNMLPLLDDDWQGGGPIDDEPTLPRSKKMKLFHKATSVHDIIDGIALSRQTTPIFWNFPCL